MEQSAASTDRAPLTLHREFPEPDSLGFRRCARHVCASFVPSNQLWRKIIINDNKRLRPPLLLGEGRPEHSAARLTAKVNLPKQDKARRERD